MATQRIVLFMVTSYLCYQLACSQDVSSINSTDSSCVGAGESAPSNVTVSDIRITSANIRWEVKDLFPPDVRGFEVLYWPVSTTTYQNVSISRSDVRGTNVSGLQPYTQYSVAVRWFCMNKQHGHASASTTFTTEATDPSASVTNVTVERVGPTSQVTISWLPLQESQWNGQPYGYTIQISTYSLESMCGGEPSRLETKRCQYPRTSLTYDISFDGCYRVNVFPTNNRKVGPSSEPLYFTSTNVPQSLNIFPADEVPTPTPEEPTPFLESPYVYIIVVVVVAVIPVVVGIVLFKKAIEKKRNKVEYCREIDDAIYSGIPLQTLSPLSPPSSIIPSPQASTAMPGSFRPQPFSPIGSSPMPPLPPHMYPSVDPPDYAEARDLPAVFGMAPVHSPPATKPHFPNIPRSAEGGIPMTRSYTLEQPRSEVFGGTQQEVRQGRQRAHTEGGIPSPYENPVNGSSTLSRIDCKRSHNMDEKGAIPPPPSHAPPPLTQSSLEIFARMRRSPPHGNQRNQQMEQQHGMSQRSYSTTNTDGLVSPSSNPMRTIRSAGHLNSLDTMPEEGSGRRQPQDSSADHTSALAQEKSATATLEKQAPLPPPPPRHAMHHSPPAHPNLPPQPQYVPNLPPQPQYVPNGSAITTNSDFSSFSEMTDADSAHFPAGRPPHVPVSHHGPREKMAGPRRYNTPQRESVFSETSTEEPSISSGSIRGVSPSAAPSWVNGSLDIDPRRSLSPGTPSTDTRTLRSEVHSPPKSPP